MNNENKSLKNIELEDIKIDEFGNIKDLHLCGCCREKIEEKVIKDYKEDPVWCVVWGILMFLCSAYLLGCLIYSFVQIPNFKEAKNSVEWELINKFLIKNMLKVWSFSPFAMILIGVGSWYIKRWKNPKYQLKRKYEIKKLIKEYENKKGEE